MTVNAVPYVIQALSHPADNFRRALSFVGLGQQGVRSWVSGDMAVSQNGTPNMSVNIAAGQALINGSQNLTSQGAYEMLNDATVNLAIAAADPTNPRIDIVCASIQDAAYSGATNTALLQVVTGTPAPSPSPPATPNNAIVLAQVAVAANATSITNGNITDKRPQFGSLFHAEVYLNVAQSVPNATNTRIGFDTVEADPNSNFTIGASAHYTCPVPGRYLVSALVGFLAADGTIINIQLTKNAVLSRMGTQTPAGGASVADVMGAAIIRASASDTLEVFCFQNTGGASSTTNGPSGCYAQFTYLGPL